MNKAQEEDFQKTIVLIVCGQVLVPSQAQASTPGKVAVYKGVVAQTCEYPTSRFDQGKRRRQSAFEANAPSSIDGLEPIGGTNSRPGSSGQNPRREYGFPSLPLVSKYAGAEALKPPYFRGRLAGSMIMARSSLTGSHRY